MRDILPLFPSYEFHSSCAAESAAVIAVTGELCIISERSAKYIVRTHTMSALSLNSAIIAAYEASVNNSYCVYAALALASYEHMITFRHECEFLWRRRWTAGTWLFIANRYTLLASIIAQVVPFSSQISCMFAALILPPAVFSALRVFALTRNYVAGCMVLFSFVPVGIDLYQARRDVYHYDYDPILGSQCFSRSTLSNFTAFSCKSSTSCMIAPDLVAVVTTWVKTYHHVRQAASVGIKVSFGAKLIQYGTLYFAVLLAVTILPLVITLTPSIAQFTGPMNIFIDILPNILISRFLINLRQVESPASQTISRFDEFSAPGFRVPALPEVIGNLGEPLGGSDETYYDEEYSFDAYHVDECTNEQQDYGDGDISSIPYAGSEIEEVRTPNSSNSGILVKTNS
ncbi:hypothetical protein NM688_g1207 [Phlebia brevispora]|uniref:Uncharacterized protein n=1 Tax=Phlebia brevispora TaxID=194682 RepID=A0ACC1TC50_9APHY|nr:hypothetical protein NM688_g1207 [Phlebia brevispora]